MIARSQWRYPTAVMCHNGLSWTFAVFADEDRLKFIAGEYEILFPWGEEARMIADGIASARRRASERDLCAGFKLDPMWTKS